jgi:hypothetical protein
MPGPAQEIGREQLETWATEIRKTGTHLDEFL